MDNNRALCKIEGVLCIAVFSKNKNGYGKCPTCRQTKFHEHKEWIECDHCDFSILQSDYKRIVNSQD